MAEHILWSDLVAARNAQLAPVKDVWLTYINDALQTAAADLTVNQVTFSTTPSGELRQLPGGEPGAAYVAVLVSQIQAEASAAGFPANNPSYSPSGSLLIYNLPSASEL